jgi:hypothetical protein
MPRNRAINPTHKNNPGFVLSMNFKKELNMKKQKLVTKKRPVHENSF